MFVDEGQGLGGTPETRKARGDAKKHPIERERGWLERDAFSTQKITINGTWKTKKGSLKISCLYVDCSCTFGRACCGPIVPETLREREGLSAGANDSSVLLQHGNHTERLRNAISILASGSGNGLSSQRQRNRNLYA